MNRIEFEMEHADDDAPITDRCPPPESELRPISPEQRRWEQFVGDLIARKGINEPEQLILDPEYRVMYKVLEVQFGINGAKEIEDSYFESIK